MPKTDGGPAYPCDVLDWQEYTGEQVVRYQEPGMSKLERFAMAAMQAILTHENRWLEMKSIAANSSVPVEGVVGHFAYKQARAMIEAGEEEGKDG
jgi:N-acetylneuraminic acid mutarotase